MIQEYVVNNWDSLPKSKFNQDECVIIKELSHNNYGWGNHSYEGIGVDREGNVVWCYSSGCSCNGSCGIEHKNTTKVLYTDLDLPKISPKEINFEGMQVSFNDY